MSKRKDPASVIVEFFETAAPGDVQMMLRIVTGIAKRRVPAPKRAARPNQPAGALLDVPETATAAK